MLPRYGSNFFKGVLMLALTWCLCFFVGFIPPVLCCAPFIAVAR